MTSTLNFENSRWQTAAIFQIIKSPYLHEKSSDFDEIWYTTAYLELDDSHVTNMKFLKIQDGVHTQY